MTVLSILRHRWKQWWRSPYERNILATAVLFLSGAYFSLLSAVVGWFYPDIVAALAVDCDPIRLLDAFALHAFGGLTVIRFSLQRPAWNTVRPYLKLPISRAQLTKALQVASTLSLFNLLPIALLASLWGSTVLPTASMPGAVFWALGALAMVLLTHFASSLLQIMWDRRAGSFVIGAICAYAAATYLGDLPDPVNVRAGSIWLFEGLRRGRILPLAATGLSVLASALMSHWMIRQRLYEILEGVSRNPLGSYLSFPQKERLSGQLALLVLLDAKLILRNERPRQMLMAGLPFAGAFFFLLANDPTPANRFLFGFMVSGYAGLTYTQFGYAWHGCHFDRLAVQAFSPEILARAQFTTFFLLCVVNAVLVLPIALWIKPDIFLILVSNFFYHVGITSFFLTSLGALYGEPINIRENTFFNYQGVSIYHFISIPVLLSFPFYVASTFGETTSVILVSFLGLTGVVLSPLSTRAVGYLIWKRRHHIS